MVRLFLFALLLCLPLAAHAQGGNVFLGYSYLNAEAASRSNLNGWNGSLEGKLFPFIGIVADLSGHYGHENISFACTGGIGACGNASLSTRQYNFVFGPRVSVSVAGIRPFAHYLIGGSHINLSDGFGSDTSFSQAVGGGIDLKPIPLIGWRFQGDLLQTRFFGTHQNDFRFSTGIVLHF